MLGTKITDSVESAAGTLHGLGLLDVDITFAPTKTLAHPTGTAFGANATGYEIHHGQVTRRATELDGLITLPDGTPEGALTDVVAGTHWHGLLENDQVRREFLCWAADGAGRNFVPAENIEFAAIREAQLDLLADLVADNLDTDMLRRLLTDGSPPGLPVLPPGAAN